MSGYRGDLLAKYGRENIQRAVNSSRVEWAEAEAQRIAVQKAGERADVVTSISNGEQPGQTLLDRFPRTAAGRQQAADAILTAVKTGRMTPEQARAILNDQVTTPGGTKSLSDMFPDQFGDELLDNITQIDQQRRGRTLREDQLAGAEWMKGQRKRLAELAKDGVPNTYTGS